MDLELCKRVLRNASIVAADDDSLTCTEQDSPGMSYSSLLKRFRIVVTRKQHHSDHDGIQDELFVIVKSNPEEERISDSFFDKMFTCEIQVYQNVLPLFKEYFQSTGHAIIWPELYAVSEKSRIIVEDLKSLNYRNDFRETGSTLEEAKLAISSLAKFHSASFIAKYQGKIDERILLPYFYCRKDESNNSFFKNGLKILVATMRQSWGDSWSELADLIERFSDNLGETFLKLHLETEDKFKVVNHGDFWRANLMYRYDDKGCPLSFRFVDFQLSHYGSLAWDLAYFLFLNPNLDLLHLHIEDLLGYYQKTMVQFLRPFSCLIEPLTVDEIKLELDRFLMYGFMKCCTDLPYQICSFNGGIDAENLFKNNEETEALKLKLYSAESYVDILKSHVLFLKKKNVTVL